MFLTAQTQEAQYTGGAAQLTLYSGSIVANDCNILASNGQTQNTQQWCNGDYDNNSSVDCKSINIIKTLVRTIS